MKLFVLALTFVSLTFSSANGFEEDTLLKQKDNNSLDFQKVVMEQNLRTKLQAVVGPLFAPARYDLDVSINYKIFKGNRRSAGGEIELDKYGMVAPTISQEVLQTDLLSNIGWINVKLVAHDHIPEEKLALFDGIAKKVVDMVPAWRVRVSTTNPPAPVKVEQPFKETATSAAPYFVGFGLAAVIFVGFFFFFYKRWLDAYAHAKANEKKEEKSEEKNAEQPSHSHTQTYAHQASRAEPAAEATAPEATLVFEAEFREIEPEVEKPTRSSVPSEAVADVFELLERSTPNTEKKVFDSIIKSGKTDVLREAATAYFPAELMFNLPPQILTSALDLMPLDDRLGLILCLEAADSSVLINCLNEKARAYMELELEKNQANSAVKLEIRRNASRYRKTFADLVRQVLRSNTEYSALAQPQLDEWLQRKSRGVRDVS